MARTVAFADAGCVDKMLISRPMTSRLANLHVKGPSLRKENPSGRMATFTSQSETQGIVILEAMAVGTPVVALDATGVRDVVVNGRNG